jgi:hypothetical protein
MNRRLKLVPMAVAHVVVPGGQKSIMRKIRVHPPMAGETFVVARSVNFGEVGVAATSLLVDGQRCWCEGEIEAAD